MDSTSQGKNRVKIFSVTHISKRITSNRLKYFRELLCQVRRKIKQEENETPRKCAPPDQSQEKISIYEKPTAQK